MFLKRYKHLYAFKKYYAGYRGTIRLLSVVMILASSLGMLLPYFTSKRIIGVTELDGKSVVTYSAVIMGVIVFHHLFWYLWEKIGSRLNNNVAVDIRKDIVACIMNTQYCEIKHKSSGYYLERMNDDVLEVSTFYYMVMSITADSITNISFLILIFALNYQCGLIFTAGIIFMYAVDSIKLKKDIAFTERLKTISESFNSKINENFRGIKDIKGLGIKNETIAKTAAISEEYAKLQIQKDKSMLFYSRIKTFSQHLIESILFVFAIVCLLPMEAITVVILLTIINYGGFMYDLVGYFAKLKDYYVRGDFKAGRILEITDGADIEQFGSYRNRLCDYSLKVSDLSYAYEDNREYRILKNISFSVSPQTAHVFIGSSGSGKSTLFGLLSKLLKCDDSKIFIGGKDINELSEETFRQNVCIVNQEPFLINDTVLNNIKIVKENAGIDEVDSACKKANIYNEIMGFEKGFETIVRENGSNLSGGQKQRLAIARAILKNAPVLLFDEPTSALDNVNQTIFLETIKTLKEEKTILIIAHKLNEYGVFDKVYELTDGELREVMGAGNLMPPPPANLLP